MIELGQLENSYDDFTSRKVKIVAISPDSLEDTRAMQARFPNLELISDADHSMADAAHVLGPHKDPSGHLTNSPTTILVDQHGQVRWIYRPDRYLTRLSPVEALAKVDEYFR